MPSLMEHATAARPRLPANQTNKPNTQTGTDAQELTSPHMSHSKKCLYTKTSQTIHPALSAHR